MKSSQEAWQESIYNARKNRYLTEELPTADGFPSLLITYREHQRMIERLKPASGQKVLDIGCSSGSMLNYLAARYGCKGTGMDISAESVQAAKSRNPHQNEYSVGSAEHPLPFQDEQFDVVICMDVLEHVEKPFAAVREIFRVLKPGGNAIIHVPVTDIKWSMDWFALSLNRKAFEKWIRAAGHDYNVMLSRSEIEKAVIDAGLKISYSQRFNSFFQNIFDYHMVHRILNRMFYLQKWPFRVYHRILAPCIELALIPDRLFQKLNVGASVYILARKPQKSAPGA
jgi:2-polyprenyl-3-methyl-5-hydroxy-6-metoxy-1,4-benzoquinol methylase